MLLVHPGGPFWAKRDDGAWSIPKGEYEDGEDPQAAARREFEEELGSPLPEGAELRELGEVKQKNRKVVAAWAVEGDLDASAAHSNTFEMEWPPRSGRRQEFPEIDRAEWFPLARAREKLLPAQAAFLDRLEEEGGRLGGAGEVPLARGDDGERPALEAGLDVGAVEQLHAGSIHEVQVAQVEQHAGSRAAALTETVGQLAAAPFIQLTGDGHGVDPVVDGYGKAEGRVHV